MHKILAVFQQSMDNASDVQLKILQALLPLLTNYPSIHHEQLIPCFLICFHLSHSKTMMIQNSASATLRQLCVYLFERMEKGVEGRRPSASDLGLSEAPNDDLQPSSEPIKPVVVAESELHPNALDAFCLFKVRFLFCMMWLVVLFLARIPPPL